MNTFQLEVVTPEGTVANRTVISVEVPSDSGRMTLLAHHQPMICSLQQGKLRLVAENGEEQWNIQPGFLRVADSRATVAVRAASQSR